MDNPKFDSTIFRNVFIVFTEKYSAFSLYHAGYYVYAEASFPRRAGDRAHLVSPKLIGDYCVQFYYHMYGNSYMGTLRILKLVGAQRTTLKTYSGNRGNRWLLIKTDISAVQNQQVKFAIE